MKPSRSLGALLVVTALAVAASQFHGGSAEAQSAAPQDSAAQAWAQIAEQNHKDAEEVRAKIKDVAEAPDDSVFKNVKALKGISASHLVNAMEFGYARALGVRCQHCHVEGKYDSEDKKQKQIARDMMLMQKAINDTLLAKIPNLKSAKPTVNCTTCHRGQVKPATSMKSS